MSKRVGRYKGFDQLPLFASDQEIGEAVLGPGKAKEFIAAIPLWERRGFPGVDALAGGLRYVPAIKAFFDQEYKLQDGNVASAPHAPAELGAWKGKRHRD
jgi:hypothetical protein